MLTRVLTVDTSVDTILPLPAVLVAVAVILAPAALEVVDEALLLDAGALDVGELEESAALEAGAALEADELDKEAKLEAGAAFEVDELPTLWLED